MAVVVFVAPIALGSWHPYIITALLGLMLVAVVAMVAPQPRGEMLNGNAVFCGLLALATLWLVQLAPLPSEVLRTISPEAVLIHERALTPVGGSPPTFVSMSLDPSATILEVAKLITISCAYLVAFHWARAHGLTTVLRLVAIAGITVGIVWLIHWGFGVEKVGGVYQPKSSPARLTGAPLINTNHLAGFLVMAHLTATGLAWRDRQGAIRWVWQLGAILCGVGVVLTRSIGGISALLLGYAIFLVLIRRARHDHESRPRLQLFQLVVPLALVVVSLVFVVSNDSDGNFGWQGVTYKLGLIGDGLHMARAFPWTGVGRGAFQAVFPRYSSDGHYTFSHAECLPIQLAAEIGFPAAIAATVGLLWVVRLGIRNAKGSHSCGAVAGVLALGLQNMADFSLELIGVALPAVVAIAAVIGHRATPKLGGKEISSIARLAGVFLGIGTLALLWRLPGDVRFTLDQDTRSARELIRSKAPRERAHKVLAEAMSRHPADYFLPYLGAIWAEQSGDDEPIRWLNHSLALNPSFGPTHLEVAHHLLGSQRLGQAVLEYRLALNAAPTLAPMIVQELVSARPAFETLDELANGAPNRLEILDLVSASLGQRGLVLEAAKADDAILVHDPLHSQALRRKAQRAWDGHDLEATKLIAARLAKRDPIWAAVFLSRVYSKKGQHDLALATVRAALPMAPNHPDLLIEVASCEETAGNLEAAETTLVRLVTISEPQPMRCNSLFRLGEFSERHNRVTQAQAYYEQSARECGSDAALIALARVAEAFGDLAASLDALEQLRQKGQLTQHLAAKLDEVRGRLGRERLEALIAH